MFQHIYSIYPSFSVNSSLYIIQCGIETCLPDYNYGPVMRDHHLLHFIAKGEGTLEMNNKIFEIHAGQGFYIPTSIQAKYTANKKNPWTYCWLGFDGADSISALAFRNLSAQFPVFSFSLESNVQNLMDELIRLYSSNGNDFLTMSYLYRFFALINPNFKLEHEKNASFERIITYIKNNFKSDISISKMAEHFNISTSKLFRDFKRNLNMSPQEYIKQYRIFYAAHLLASTNLSIEQVALLSGYNDICNFSKRFKSIYKRSPSAHRKYINVHSNVILDFKPSQDDSNA